MKNLKIKCFGAKGNILCQLDRIETGLKLLNHEIIEDGPCDFIYSNDPGFFKEAIEYKNKYKEAKLILNVLDIPFNCIEVRQIIDDLSVQLPLADGVTTISETVKKQMEIIFPFLQGKISVIYQPIKDVYYSGLEREKRAMVCGRLNDLNKRTKLAIETCAILNLPLDCYGGEDPSNLVDYGYRKIINYKGLVSDEELNRAYNTHCLYLTTSVVEGLHLPSLEAIISLTPIVCCNHMYTASEFIPLELQSNPNVYDIVKKVEWILSNKDKVQNILQEYSEKYSVQFSKIQVARNIIEVFNKL